MKSAWFSDRRHYEFAKCVQSADDAQHRWQLMQDFLQVACGAFRQSSRVTLGQPMDDEIEAAVVRSQKRIKHPGRFAECLGIVIMALDEDPHDFLGSTISELGQNDAKWKGQCFTPDPLCRMMAEMTIGDFRPDPKNRLMFSEPACGGGAMVIATSEVLKKNGFYPWNYYWTCVDVDWRMFAITYIQLTLLGIPAGVIHGNTLSLETFDSAITFAAAMHPLRNRIEEQPDLVGESISPDRPIRIPREDPRRPDQQKPGQLSLFDAWEKERT